MKEKFIAHWGKALCLVSVVFLFFSISQASVYQKRVDDMKNKVITTNKNGNAQIKKPVTAELKKIELKKEIKPYFTSSVDGSYQLKTEPSTEAESWGVATKPLKVMVGSDIRFTIPKSAVSSYLKDLNSSDIKLIIKQNFSGEIDYEILDSGKEIKIKGLETTEENEPIQVIVRNMRFGDMAKFYVQVEQQIKLYYHVPVDSIKISYDKEISLDTISMNWKKASVSILDKELLKIASYTLLRKETLTGTTTGNYKVLKTWEAKECPFEFTDKVKPLHDYSYQIKVDVWHTPNKILTNASPITNNAFPVKYMTGEWLITKSKEVQYKASPIVSIGKGKILISFTRKKEGFTEPEAELAVKKWENGQWLAGLITISKIQKVLAFGNTPQLFPKLIKEKTIANQIKDNDLVALKGLAQRVLVRNTTFKNIPFEVDDYKLYKIKEHEKGGSLNPLLIQKKYLDNESLKTVYDPVTKTFKEKCFSFWLIDTKKDLSFFQKQVGYAFPSTVLVYFGSNNINRKLRPLIKALNTKADPAKVVAKASNIIKGRTKKRRPNSPTPAAPAPKPAPKPEPKPEPAPAPANEEEPNN